MSAVWLIQYIPTEEYLPIVYVEEGKAIKDLNHFCILYNVPRQRFEHMNSEIYGKKLLADLLLSNINIKKANKDDFKLCKIEKLSAALRIDLHNKLYNMVSHTIK